MTFTDYMITNRQLGQCFWGTYKVRNEIETKRSETKRNQRKRNETKRNETKSTKTKRNETKSTK